MAEREQSHVTKMFELGWPIEQAIRSAVLEAVLAHRRAGRPIVSWQDGKVVELWGEAIDRAVIEDLVMYPPSRLPPPVDPVQSGRRS